MIRISKSTARKLNPLKNIVYAAIKENIRIKINKERFSRNCFLSSLNDHDFFLNLISPISLKKIVHEEKSGVFCKEDSSSLLEIICPYGEQSLLQKTRDIPRLMLRELKN